MYNSSPIQQSLSSLGQSVAHNHEVSFDWHLDHDYQMTQWRENADCNQCWCLYHNAVMRHNTDLSAKQPSQASDRRMTVQS